MDQNNFLQADWQACRGLAYLDPNPSGGQSVLLLHGLGVNGDSWAYQTRALCEAGLRPLPVDLPGFCRSTRPLGRWSIHNAVCDIARLIEELDIIPVAVVGLSLGGTIAQTLAHQYPQSVERLVLVNTFACLRPRRAAEWFYLLRRFVIAHVRGHSAQAQTVAWRIFPRTDQAEYRAILAGGIQSTDPVVYRQAMRALALFDMRTRLPSIRVPTLIVSGNEDTTVGLPVQAELARSIPGSRHIVLDNAGHAAPIDQPEAFNRVLLEFLTGA